MRSILYQGWNKLSFKRAEPHFQIIFKSLSLLYKSFELEYIRNRFFEAP